MELFRALGVLCEPPAPGHDAVARALGLPARASAAEATELFVLELPPYASIYLGAEGMIGGEARDRIAGFWRALGLVPPAEPDHLAALLGLYAELAERAAPGAARQALLWEHLVSWLPFYLDAVREQAGPFQRAWAVLLEEALLAEAGSLPGGDPLPLQLREAPPLADPREEGLDAFAGSLLAPARSGVLLTRARFGLAARELELGLRAGSRRVALGALLAQDAAPVLVWLAGEARRQRERHRRRDRLGPVAAFWAARAAATAGLLEELTEAATKEVVHA
jgi:hypothetical protein